MHGLLRVVQRRAALQLWVNVHPRLLWSGILPGVSECRVAESRDGTGPRAVWADEPSALSEPAAAFPQSTPSEPAVPESALAKPTVPESALAEPTVPESSIATSAAASSPAAAPWCLELLSGSTSASPASQSASATPDAAFTQSSPAPDAASTQSASTASDAATSISQSDSHRTPRNTV